VWARVSIASALLVLGFLLTVITPEPGPSAMSFALFPIPVAIAVVRRRFNFVHALFACAAVSGAAGVAMRVGVLQPDAVPDSGERVLRAALAAVFYIFVAFAGVPLGWGILSRWSYGRTVALVTAVAFAVVLPMNIWGWPVINEQCMDVLDGFEARLDRSPDAAGEEAVEQQLESLAWIREHNVDLWFGLVCFGTVLAGACVALSLTSAVLRVWFGEPGPTSSFAEMRPPDWLAWIVIVVALLFFVEQRWPADWLRAGVWNTAFALGVIYWLNGLSVLAFTSNTLHPNMLVFAIVMFVLLALGLIPIFCMAGLFDTWFDFRTRVTKLAEALNRPRDDA